MRGFKTHRCRQRREEAVKQHDFTFEFLGLTVFYDPPKKGIKNVFQQIYDAGIKVKVITGDNADTTKAIANQRCNRF